MKIDFDFRQDRFTGIVILVYCEGIQPDKQLGFQRDNDLGYIGDFRVGRLALCPQPVVNFLVWENSE